MNWSTLITVLEPCIGILVGAFVLGLMHYLGSRRVLGSILRRALFTLPLFIRWILVAVLLSILLVATQPLRDLLTSHAFEIDKLQEHTGAKDTVDELKWMLTILAGFAVIVSIAQAAAAWVSALTYDKQATAKLKEIELNLQTKKNESDAELTRLKLSVQSTLSEATQILEQAKYDAAGKLLGIESQATTAIESIRRQGVSDKGDADAKLAEIEKVLKSVKARYPLFYEVEEKRNQAHDALTAALRRIFETKDDASDPTEGLNYMKEIYHELDVETRQLVLSVESFASIDLQPPSRGSEVANLKLFAVFYHAKYRYEKGLQGTMSLGDLERAEGYLLLALRKTTQDFTLHNELGHIYITIHESVRKVLPDGYPDFLDKAKRAFAHSLELESNQQRAHYNLAYIMANHERKYKDAAELLSHARCLQNWQRATTPPGIISYLIYNQGCYLAQTLATEHLGENPVSKDEASLALRCLEDSVTTGMILNRDLNNDFRNDGFILPLYQKADVKLKAALDKLRPIEKLTSVEQE